MILRADECFEGLRQQALDSMCRVFEENLLKTLHMGSALGYEKSREYAVSRDFMNC
jgi:hypothetical protein